MSFLTDLGSSIVNKSTSLVTKVEKAQPEIALVGGIAAGVAAAWSFAKAYKDHTETFKEVESYVEVAKGALDMVRENDAAEENDRVQLPIDRKEAVIGLVRAYGAYTGTLVRAYGPTVLWGGISIFLLTKGHMIMKDRNAVLLSAVKALEFSYRKYRERVVEDHGPEKDQVYFTGAIAQKVVEHTVGEDGKKTKKERVELTAGDDEDLVGSLYNKVFDQNSTIWEIDRATNRLKLSAAQDYLNQLLNARGYVLLNELYESIGLPATSVGCVAGWALEAEGDDFIDLGLDSPVNRVAENKFLITPNVNGVVYEHVG